MVCVISASVVAEASKAAGKGKDKGKGKAKNAAQPDQEVQHLLLYLCYRPSIDALRPGLRLYVFCSVRHTERAL